MPRTNNIDVHALSSRRIVGIIVVEGADNKNESMVKWKLEKVEVLRQISPVQLPIQACEVPWSICPVDQLVLTQPVKAAEF